MWIKIILTVLAVFVFNVSCVSVKKNSAVVSPVVNAVTVSDGNKVFSGINAERRRKGRKPLIRDAQIDSLAASHNAHMIKVAIPRGVIKSGHDNAKSRAKANRARGFLKYAENTAGIRAYPSSLVSSVLLHGWITSPGHYKNIIGDYSYTGMAVSIDPRDGAVYATQIFAQ